MYRNVLDTGVPFASEDFHLPRLRHGVMTDAYYSFSYNPIWDERNEVGGIVVICEETTEAVLARKRLAEHAAVSAQIDEILEGMGEGFFALDKDWTVLRVNDQFERIVEKKREDALGRNFIDLFFSTPEQRESLYMKSYTKVMVERVPDSFVDYYEPLNIWTAVNAYPTSSGGMGVFFREVSAERIASQNLRDAVTRGTTLFRSLPMSSGRPSPP